MDFEAEFEKIRPYNDSEVKDAIEELLTDDNFDKISKYFISEPKAESLKELREINTIEEFQNKYSHRFVRRIINETTDGLTSSGSDEIIRKGHLFIANHRDIVLDSAFLQIMLIDNGLPTSEITVGDNLMANSLFNVLGKLNKVFTLYRGGGKIQMYKNAVLHSKYIHNLIREKNDSLWIAQRDGRTKDGKDKTQQGLIKMLLGDRRDIVNALEELAIVPISMSYEFEPCLRMKTRELYISSYQEYVKQDDEDMYSTTSSMLAYKGRVHIAFCEGINKKIKNANFDNLSNNEIVDFFVKEIDNEIYKNYKLWPNNYIAFDILNNTNKFINEYSTQEKSIFETYLMKSISDIEGDAKEIKEIALGIYANPLKNKFNL